MSGIYQIVSLAFCILLIIAGLALINSVGQADKWWKNGAVKVGLGGMACLGAAFICMLNFVRLWR